MKVSRRFSQILAIWLCLGALPLVAYAADDNGNFAIKGGGLQSCQALIKAFEGQTDDLKLYAGWIDGYLTGLNQFTDQTYDFAAWQTSDTLLGMTYSVCQEMPDETRMMDAFIEIVRLIQPGRIVTEDGMIALLHEGQGTAVYEKVLDSLKSRLQDLGYEPGINIGFEKETAQAIALYQKDAGLPQSGLPDQQTLYNLFRAP